ncbi:MAG: hypothetical protein JWN76_823 [Chitinophagaceae bacterium]|nr:hypothetical protein [Chitinophagaceae bacterium]
MKKRKPAYNFLIWFLLTGISISPFFSSAQTSGGNFNLHFLKDSLQNSGSVFFFNNVTIRYTGTATRKIKLGFQAGPAISIISALSSMEFDNTSNSVKVLPIRFTINNGKHLQGWQEIKVQVQDEKGSELSSSSFYVNIPESRKWKATVSTPSIVVTGSEDKVPFSFTIENNGNTDETYTYKIVSDQSVNVINNPQPVKLEPGANQVMNAQIDVNNPRFKKLSSEEIVIEIKSSLGEIKNLNIHLTRISSNYTENLAAWRSVPLTLELNAQNLLTEFPFYNVGLFGNIKMGKGKRLNVFYRTNNFQKDAGSNTETGFLEYQTDRWDYLVGYLNEFNGFIVDGLGVKIRHMLPNGDQYQAYGLIKGRNYDGQNITFNSRTTLTPKLRLSSSLINNDDKTLHVKSYASVFTADYDVLKKTTLSLSGGAGYEKIQKIKYDTAVSSSVVGYKIQTFGKKYNLISGVSWYSKNYPGLYRGSTIHNHDFTYRLGKKISAGAFMSCNKRIFSNITDSILYSQFNIDDKEYGIKTIWQGAKFNFSFSPSLFYQHQDSANSFVAKMYKASTYFTYFFNSTSFIYVSENIGYISFPDMPAYKPFLTLRNVINGQYKNYGLQFAYDNAPYFYFEIKDNILNPSAYQRMQFLAFWNIRLGKNIENRVNIGYNKELPNGSQQKQIINTFKYTLPDKGLDFLVYTQLIPGNAESNIINLTLRKALNVPLFKNQDVKSFSLRLFKDQNGNRVYDASDEVLANRKLVVNGLIVQSDDKGIVNFKNVVKKTYELDFSSVSNLRGWIPMQGLKQSFTLTENQREINIAFKESASVQGKLLLDKDDKSSLSFEPGGIRITALANTGESYFTLTDANGEFYFNLPSGQYLLFVNETVFDENFKPAEPSRTIDLQPQQKLEVNFEIRQKRRAINIKKG